MMPGIPGYPIPSQNPNVHDPRPDPDEDNPNELVLDGSEVQPALPPLDLLTRRDDAPAEAHE